jgi:hypothetical protein
MIRHALVGALLSASVAGAQASDRARGVIIGVVADSSLRPIVGAAVSFAGSSVRVATDSLGRFRVVNVPPGRFLMIARSIGYRPATSPVDIAEHDTLRLAFTLEPATAQELATVVITERTLSKRLQEFEERRKLGFGEFFTRADIEKVNGVKIGDVLRRSKAARVDNSGNGVISAREFLPCPMAIYVDGIHFSNGRISDLPSPNEVAAIEVYAGSATVPIWLSRGQIGTKVGCGAILVWTRDGSEG